MKKFFILLIILAAAAFFYFMSDISSNVDNETGKTNENNFRPDPSSATFTFDGEPTTLSKGKNANEETLEETAILENIAYGDLNADGKEDALIFLARSGGGSGVFIYTAGFISGPVNYKGTNAVFLGDRVSPQNISIRNGVATVTYLDRSADEPFVADPTIMTAKQLIYRNGLLTEK